MDWLGRLWGAFAAVILAVGQLFRWLNNKQVIDDERNRKQRVARMQRSAAKPSRENANRLNRWLHRGRSGRLRDPGER